jgi:hypothetical protein
MIERRMEVLGRRGGRRKLLLDDIKETWGCWKLKEDCTRELALEEAMVLLRRTTGGYSGKCKGKGVP